MNPHIKGSWLEWEVDVDKPTPILVIETDISTSPGENGIDSSAMDDLIDDAKAKHAHPNLDIKRVRIVPAGFYSP